MPKEGSAVRKPAHILSKNKLLWSWRESKGSKKSAGSPGIDGVSAASFAANLNQNLSRIALQLRDGSYNFSGLKPIFIPKPNSPKDRLICIPTVQDRLVQRAIAWYLSHHRKLPIYNVSSYGFIQDAGMKRALEHVVGLRASYTHVFETDIVGFFDEIDRKLLAEKLRRALGRQHSLLPILSRVIACEIKTKHEQTRAKLEGLNIRHGCGLRQGMPLSPALSNLALSTFDRNIQNAGLRMIRYADDIVVFAESERSAHKAAEIVQRELEAVGHRIPALAENGKTRIVSKFEPLHFLGREIAFSQRDGRYVQKISRRQIQKISAVIACEYSLERLIENGTAFPEFSRKLSSTIVAYLSAYRNVHNYAELESEIRGAGKAALRQVYIQIFDKSRIEQLPKRYASFLGIVVLDLHNAAVEFEML